jgi:hypothetical protein
MSHNSDKTNRKSSKNKSEVKDKETDRLIFCIIKDLQSKRIDKIIILKPEMVIKWHGTAL